MKRLLASLIFIAATTTVTYAQKGALFQFNDKNDTYDFGKVKEGEKVEHVYEFKNIGDQPLQILRVDASCGCTQPDWTKTPVLPGKTGKVSVVFNSADKVGRTIKEITIQSNAVLPDKAKERYTLYLKGEVTK